MIKHRIFTKGERCHVLVTSFTHPDILIPVKAVVKDVQWDDVNPLYLIKILKFYDSATFLSKYLFTMRFSDNFNKKPRTFKLKNTGFKYATEIEEALNQHDEKRYYIVVDSIMAVKSKLDLKDLYNKMTYYIISKKYKEIKTLTTRGFYDGIFRLDGIPEFNSRFKKMYGDVFEENNTNINNYLGSL